MSEPVTFARPYARAAYEHAVAHDAVAAWGSQLRTLCALLAQERLVAANLAEDQLAEMLISLCDDALEPDVANFIRHMAYQRRLALLAEVLSLFQSAATAHSEAAVAEVVSAHPLDADEQAALRARLEKPFGRRIDRLALSVDPSLRGGVLARIGDMTLDLSLRGRVAALRASLT